MIAVIVTDCASCPFVIADGQPWFCDALGFDSDDSPRQIPDRNRSASVDRPPPDWCPLREADRIVTLRVGK